MKRDDLGTWVLTGDASDGGWRRRLRVSPVGPPAVARWHGGVVAWWCGGCGRKRNINKPIRVFDVLKK